jgi:hypothetical protein
MGKKDKDYDKDKVKKKKKKKRDSTRSISGNSAINHVTTSSVGAGDVLAQVRPSAFRAINIMTDQPVAANIPLKIAFPSVQFDLTGEFNPATSTFIPSTNGVYFVLGAIAFNPYDPNGDYRTRIEIHVNGKRAVAIDNDFFGGGTPYLNDVAVSTILQLQAGDRVEVFAESNIPGIFVASEDPSRFEAARFPSPTA